MTGGAGHLAEFEPVFNQFNVVPMAGDAYGPGLGDAIGPDGVTCGPRASGANVNIDIWANEQVVQGFQDTECFQDGILGADGREVFRLEALFTRMRVHHGNTYERLGFGVDIAVITLSHAPAGTFQGDQSDSDMWRPQFREKLTRLLTDARDHEWRPRLVFADVGATGDDLEKVVGTAWWVHCCQASRGPVKNGTLRQGSGIWLVGNHPPVTGSKELHVEEDSGHMNDDSFIDHWVCMDHPVRRCVLRLGSPVHLELPGLYMGRPQKVKDTSQAAKKFKRRRIA